MKTKQGQILLITVMLLATVMTIVLSISFKSVTETQVTKLEEESQKALSAAESAIEVALKNNATATFGSSPELANITGFSGNATIETTTSNKFTSPAITKDGSYTFYLGEYDVDDKTIGVSTAQTITLCFQSGTINPAIEVTLVKSSGVKKYVIDPNESSPRIEYSSDALDDCTPDSNYNFSTEIPGIDIDNNGQFLLVRVLYAPTKLLFSAGNDLPLQGRTVTSQATSSTSTGVSKKVVLFQSYPQIPGEFFTTTF